MAPTPRDEILFIDALQSDGVDSLRLNGLLAQREFRKHDFELDVTDIKAFLYVPQRFPVDGSYLRRQSDAKFEKPDTTLTRHRFGNRRDVHVGVVFSGSSWLRRLIVHTQDTLIKPHQQVQYKIRFDHNSILNISSSLQQELDHLSSYAKSFGRRLVVHICGYSEGGAYAQALTVLLNHWATTKENTILCRTYDATGLPPDIRAIMVQSANTKKRNWGDRVTNYKAMPNPFNTVYLDLGKVVHVYNPDHMTCNAPWVGQCITRTLYGIAAWSTIGNSVQNMAIHQANSNAVFNPAKLLAVGVSKNQAFVACTLAAILALDVWEVVRSYQLKPMLASFDENSGSLIGLHHRNMRKWPIHEGLIQYSKKIFQQMADGLYVFGENTAGLHTLWGHGGRIAYIERKLLAMDGYEVLDDDEEHHD